MLALRVFLINTFAGKIRRSRLVNWVEKAGFKKIKKLLEIFERKRHHEILLTVKNLHELNLQESLSLLVLRNREEKKSQQVKDFVG